LYEETRHNVALRVEDGSQPDRFIVSGRGELHLAILIETMRREGYEFEVSKPEVIYHEDPDTGATLEPVEEVFLEVADAVVGTVVELLGVRRGLMQEMSSTHGTTYLRYLVPTRGLLGFRSNFMRATSGLGTLNTLFYGYEPLAGPIPGRQFGSLVAWERAIATNYALTHSQARGTFFITPGVEVYEGMVVGEHIRPEDLAVNVGKTKQLSAIHTKYYGEELRLSPPRQMSLDDCIEFLDDDELLEITPQSLRIRKRILNNEERQKDQKRRERILEGEG
ncbi:MAG: translational GTPase TypA, partial [Anaerolineae bacterium]|nr:translational GTPase TypA [Anaerolineae bacterium]